LCKFTNSDAPGRKAGSFLTLLSPITLSLHHNWR
jgi:hypothetical protein